MDIQRINQYKNTFDSISKKISNKNEDKDIIEVWHARELQSLLGYARWGNFPIATNRAIE